MEQLVWEHADLGDPTVRRALAVQIAGMDPGRRQSSLFHDPAWLLEAEGRGPADLRVHVCYAGAELRAYAPFVVQPWLMRYRMGETTLFSSMFERLHINSGPIVASSVDDSRQPDLIAELFAQLATTLSSRQVIYLEGVAEGGVVERAIAKEATRRRYRIIEPNPRYERRLVRLPGDYDAYLSSLKTQTRQNLRNSERKLERHLGGDLRLWRCTDSSQVSEFVRRAVTISKRTYQWHLLELGLRDAATLESTLTAMALHGWTRCYLLECANVATAFMIGFLYEGTYYYVDVGFDPEWEKWSVGTVLHLQVLRDLMQDTTKVQMFDFSSGTGVHKKRFSNESRIETNYLLVPRNLRNGLLVGVFLAMNAASSAAVGLLERLHLKAVIKRLVRRRATGNAPVE